MSVLRPLLAVACAAVLFLAPARADAAVELGLGGDYWVDRGGLFNLNLKASTPLAGPLSIGGRFGALLATEANTFGIPLDVILRATFSRRVYAEAMAGPWILFHDDPVRAHVGFGFGLQGQTVSFGVEVGWLDPAAMAGLRLGWRF